MELQGGLVLSRRYGERIVIGEDELNLDCVITVIEVGDGNVKLHVKAPKKYKIHREEVYQRILRGYLKETMDTGNK